MEAVPIFRHCGETYLLPVLQGGPMVKLHEFLLQATPE